MEEIKNIETTNETCNGNCGCSAEDKETQQLIAGALEDATDCCEASQESSELADGATPNVAPMEDPFDSTPITYDKDIRDLGGEDPEMDESEMDMGAMLEKYGMGDDVSRGKVIDGTIVAKSGDGWLVEVGFKCEGFLPSREWTHHILVDDEKEPQEGEVVTVQVISLRQGEEAQLIVSRWRTEFDRRWALLEEKVATGKPFKVKGLRKVKGGLMVDACGLEGFIPISHLAEEGRGVNPGRFVDTEFDVELLEKDKRKRRLVLSRRNILDEDLASKREEFYQLAQEGAILEGTVSSVTNFGAFVNVGPIDGLVHLTELSWQRGGKGKEPLKKGDVVKVKVIGIDKEKGRISLSIRQAQGDPWDNISERWTVGQKTKGVVTNLTDFGAFVEVEPGIEGLIHIGDLSWNKIKHPKEVLRKGQEVEVVILNIDEDKRRMSLGYKQLNDPWNGIEDRYQKGQDITVKVVRLVDFGAFVEIEKGVEGLIHISQLSTKRVEKPSEVLTEGQEVVARVLEVNPEERRIRLSISEIEKEAKRQEDIANGIVPDAEPTERPERPERPAKKEGSKAPRRKADSDSKPSNSYSDDTGFTFGDALGDFELD